MSRSILCKRVISQYLKTCGKCDIPQRCMNSSVQHYKLKENLFKAISPSLSSSKWQRRTVFTTSLTKSDAKSYKHSSDEPTTDVENDEEFRNILKDFANDFNLNVESEGAMLEEIKKSLNQPEVEEIPSSNEMDTNSPSNSLESSAAGKKYKKFSESDSVIIPSQEDLESGTFTGEEITFHVDQKWNRDSSHVQIKRGISGVFEIGELVLLLQRENLADIAVISVPKELHYTDFLVLVTAMSPRHSEAVAEYVIKTYKKKKHAKDPFITVEGEKTANWKCLDMGNIVLHILLEETRAFYDIESLWLFDQAFDTGGTLKSDPTYDSLEEQMAFFNSLQNSTSTKAVKEIS